MTTAYLYNTIKLKSHNLQNMLKSTIQFLDKFTSETLLWRKALTTKKRNQSLSRFIVKEHISYMKEWFLDL